MTKKSTTFRRCVKNRVIPIYISILGHEQKSYREAVVHHTGIGSNSRRTEKSIQLTESKAVRACAVDTFVYIFVYKSTCL